MSLRNEAKGSSTGVRASDNFVFSPSARGHQDSTCTPLGKYRKATRAGDLAFAGAAKAGRIASSTGRAIVAPIPRNNVLRSRCIFIEMFTAFLHQVSASEMLCY